MEYCTVISEVAHEATPLASRRPRPICMVLALALVSKVQALTLRAAKTSRNSKTIN